MEILDALNIYQIHSIHFHKNFIFGILIFLLFNFLSFKKNKITISFINLHLNNLVSKISIIVLPFIFEKFYLKSR